MSFNNSNFLHADDLDLGVGARAVHDGSSVAVSGENDMSPAEHSWPPPFTWRRSSRARRISLSVTAEKGLEIVTAKNTSEEVALAFLEEKRSWVEKHAAIIYRAAAPLQLPTEVTLNAIDRTWFVAYKSVPAAKFIRCIVDGDYIIIRGAVWHQQSVLKALRKHLKKIAHELLHPWLKSLSDSCQLPYRHLTIRAQKNIWGSCSHEDDISLNYKLLFLSPAVVEYILIHELCHTKVRNHSARFWKKVAQHCPQYELSKKQLRANAVKIPSWVSRQI